MNAVCEFLKLQYELQKISKIKLESLIGTKITRDEYEYITVKE